MARHVCRRHVPSDAGCMTCGDSPIFVTDFWDGFLGRLVPGWLCARCAGDAVKQGSEVGVDLFRIV